MSICTESRIGQRARESRCGNEITNAKYVRQIQKSAQQSTTDKTELHGNRQPANIRIAQVPFNSQRGDDRCGTEPERHAE